MIDTVMTRNAPVLLCVAILAASCRRDEPPQGDLFTDTVVRVRDDDPEMSAAISRARARLPEFWKAFDGASARGSFAVKVPVTDAAGTEFFWLIDLRRSDGRVSGRIDNRPNIVKSVTENMRLEVGESEVVDWLFLRDDKRHGNFTLRPLLKTLPPEQAAQLKAMFAEP